MEIEEKKSFNFETDGSFLGILLIAFLSLATFWSYIIPFDDAPDEWAHYYYNVHFILEHGRLPVAGVDDVSAFKAGRLNQLGQVTARYSYTNHPGLHSVVAAVCARLAHSLFDIPFHFGARGASLCWGLVFCGFLYLSLRRLTCSPKNAFWITSLFSFIPQVVFISAYTNQDIHSMALSAIAAYCLIRWKGSPSSGNLLLLACGVGGLLSCKYNYYLYFPLLALLGCAWLYFERPARAEVARLVLTVSAGCLLISGFWYIRNYILYDDILGQFTVLELMKEHQGRLGIQQPFGLSSLAWFLHREFFTITFRSTFAMFGYMSYPLSETVYQQFSWWLFAAVILFLVSLFRQADRREWFWFTLLLLLAVLQFGLLLYNAYVWDYQAQGRYLFPLLVPTALFLGYSLQQHRNQQLPISICTLAIALLLINSQKVLITEYRKGTVVPHPPIQARAAWDKTPAQPARARLAKNPLPALTEVNLLPNAKVEQQFVLNNQRLIGISVIVAPKVARTTNLHRLRLFDAKTDELLRESYLFPFEFSENNAVSFVFPTLETPTERVYRVELVALETVASPATSILCRPIDPPNILAAQINGSQISCALSLTLLFDQSGSL